MAAKKEIVGRIKLEIQAGKANPAPPIGPILGQNGIPIQEFCNEFNQKTASMGNFVIPVAVTVFKDRTFKMFIKQPTVASMIKNKISLQKGSSNPNLNKVGKISKKVIKEIAEQKLVDLNTKKLESAVKSVEGTAKSMGLEITE